MWYLHRNLRAFRELNDELVPHHQYLVHESPLVATSPATLHLGNACARDIITFTLDARLDDRPATSAPFAKLTNMLVEHQPHATQAPAIARRERIRIHNRQGCS
jgi:hypothetical protein